VPFGAANASGAQRGYFAAGSALTQAQSLNQAGQPQQARSILVPTHDKMVHLTLRLSAEHSVHILKVIIWFVRFSSEYSRDAIPARIRKEQNVPNKRKRIAALSCLRPFAWIH
jgi:hypothetical protein